MLYGVGHMVKDHSDNERGNPLPLLHGILFPISSKGSFIITISDIDFFVLQLPDELIYILY